MHVFDSNVILHKLEGILYKDLPSDLEELRVANGGLRAIQGGRGR